MKKRIMAVLLVMAMVLGNALAVYADEADEITRDAAAAEDISPDEISADLITEEETITEGPADDEITEPAVEQEEETVLPDTGSEEDNEKLFEQYLEEEIFSPEPVIGASTGKRLSGNNAVIYKKLKSLIAKVANGTRTSTSFEIPVKEMGFSKVVWTAEDLGVTAIVKNNQLTDAAVKAVEKITSFDSDAILNALLADCPYELYWFDKTAGFRFGGFGMRGTNAGGTEAVEITGAATFKLSVDPAYSAGAYEVDPTAVTTAKNAAKKAQSIVEKYREYDDYQKLYAYKNEICSLVSYNKAAAAEGADTGDPWQLVWVFDGDKNTNVVCEGYSKAFQYLFDLSEFNGKIICNMVTGAMDGGSHMWNIVTMGSGKNYLADVTNCDEGSIGADDLLFLAGTQEGSVKNGYVFTCRNNRTTRYTYDDRALSYFKTSELTIAANDYDPAADDSDSGESGSSDDGDASAQKITVKASATRVAVGKTAALTVSGAKGKVTYKSGNTAIATVSSSGKITAKKTGTVKMTVKAAASGEYRAATKTLTIYVVPAATTSLTAANTSSGIKLTWKKVTGAAGYYIYRGGTKIATVSGGSTVKYTDSSASSNGTKYVYKVVAYANSGTSTLGKSVTAYRVAGAYFTFFDVEFEGVSADMTVKWKRNAKGSGYQLQYSTAKDFSSGKKTLTVSSNTTVSKKIAALAFGKTYYCRVRAYKTVSGKKYYSAWSSTEEIPLVF